MENKKYNLIDFHSHILPGVDDGSDSLETSLKMLEFSRNQGVDVIVSTSHYYNFRESSADFLLRRNEALYRLEKHIKENDLDLPEIVAAAEVRLYPELHLDENLDKLCIGDTKNILIEMPYGSWSGWMYNEIYAVITRGYTPIMAHIERFVGPISEKDILSKLLSMEVYTQCNAESFEDRKMRKFIKKLAKLNKLTVLGSDFHNMESRISRFDSACSYIAKKFGEEYLQVLMENADYLIK
ncbi:MAG: hypothetical protein IKJ68_01620 [Clostridia bacterium]|nr:hypothetical protein [Clostridia bacterium]